MPTRLSDFIQTHQPNATIDPILAKMYRHPPTFDSTQKSPHFSPRYQAMFNEKDLLTRVMIVLCEKETLPLSCKALMDENIQKKHNTFWQSLPTDKTEVIKRNVFSNGANFNLMGLGNCAHRATYAAMELHQLLKGSEIKVKLYSLTSVDQFIVYLKTPDKSWYVYDPLTNPELLFTADEYKSEIMPLFSKVAMPATQVDLTITPVIYERYQLVCGKLESFLKQAFQNPWEDTLEDISYTMSLISAGVPPAEIKDLTKEAYQAIQAKLEQILGSVDNSFCEAKI